MIGFHCSSCQKVLQIKDEHAGKHVRCPACGQVTVAPTAASPLAPPPPAAPPLAPPSQGRAETVDLSPPRETADHGVTTNTADPVLTECLAPALQPDELGRLGKYRILKILGRGGMGVVYQGEDSVLKRRVAIKAMLPALSAGSAVRKRFLREARAMAAVEHDHVVRLYEVNEDRGIPFIAMEFLVGEPLDRRLASAGALPMPEVLRVGREIATGLAAAHARGLIHRDVKPANVWLEAPAARVKILDFGLARAEDEESRITQSGAVLGTPSYMAPEQARGEKVDFHCDLFSLGIVLYRLCTGKEPFSGPDALSTLIAVASETPPPPQVQNFDVPADLSDLIMQLLDKAPAQRGNSAQEIADALARIERGEAAPPKPATPSPAVVPPHKSKQPLYWVIVAAIVFAVCGCAGVSLLIAVLAYR